MLAGPHPDCHSSVALQTTTLDGAPAARTAAATTAKRAGREPRQQQEGGGERGRGAGASGLRGALGRDWGVGVLDGSHHVTVTTTDRRLHDT